MTGRRHQLRVHCLCLGHPIVGDATYAPLMSTIKGHDSGILLCDSPLQPEVEEDRAISVLRPLQLNETSTPATSATDDRLIERETEERMMLHAQVLRIPLPSTYQPPFKSSHYFKTLYENKIRNGNNTESYLVNVVTSDPFTLLSLY